MIAFYLLTLSILWILILARGAGAAPPHHVTISVEAFGNSVERIQGPRCDASNEVDTGKQTGWWITIGEARPNPQGGWEGVGNAIRCGVGSSEVPRAGSGSSPRAPYLMATVSAIAGVEEATRLGADKVLQIGISLSLWKLSDFSVTGEPRYKQSTENRSFSFLERGIAFLPLIVANGKEKEAFKLHEALIGIRAKLAEGKGVAAYGAASVSSDLDGAELLLDGGMVGRVSAGKATVLTNVLVGDHEVSVRDSSGREVRRVVGVEQNRTVMVSLKLKDLARNAVPYRLVFLGRNAQGFEEYRRERDEAVVVRIPAGEFLMGTEPDAQPLEHKVFVSEFLMDQTAVSWGQFKRFAGATGTSLPPNPPYWGIHDDHPAVFVTWEEGKAYCEWAGGRLPTEAEREKAARGTDGRKYPWGNEEPDPRRAVFRRDWGYVATDPVRAHPSGASPYGLLNMGGNVWEFIADWFDDKYYEVSPQRDPQGPRTGRAHVVRGGSWDSRPALLNAASRNFAYRGYREGDFGFRCAMDLGD